MNITRRNMAAGALALGSIPFVPAAALAATKDEQRAEVRNVAKQTLEQLYKLQPAAKGRVEKAAGYAAFSTFGMKLLVTGGGRGQGVAVDNKNKKETYMKMVEAQAGLGFGIKKFRLVWVFDTQASLDKFINTGWEVGAQATASAQKGGQGVGTAGAMAVSPGVWLYQLTDDGLAVELTAKGTRYYKDEELN